MSRKGSRAYVREIGVDDKYKSGLVQKFINVVMECGKKSIATRIVYEAMESLAAKTGGDDASALATFEKIISAVKPEIEVKARRVGGGMYQVPVQVRPNRALALAFRWIVNGARTRSDKTMGKRLGRELLDCLEGRGGAIKKRADVHRMADANRAFSHFAW